MILITEAVLNIGLGYIFILLAIFLKKKIFVEITYRSEPISNILLSVAVNPPRHP